ncbi:phosphoribosylaminoimidazolecarboxamide formyltransferase/IMP cyclohydrolase [Synechococcus sp. PCC 7502]|uniref:bifunctional phosphoribosylaminoimidazolecarboxamide formyltransferase/IMP cyclohydrolase n=1 Tax=Synechococcus sp. PCC 7502 TaxID=1173263 RepID=UPI00029FB029|nr:bifunctional phosphoribosylaminoimidazolecarboxamide formyltransferase/IMP cyclohydrolase [Synechococcus sp. PCC 7502]AFY73842.1 phosphoribosylaminoimidazolecarboxamide formyltransferase/IMP cyclohydrolase [Synechococcus sp. PCC 7502]
MNPVALLSVSNKTGLIELARTLVEKYKFTIISSGGTAAALKQAQIPVTKVSEYTGAPEILGGRVKTLHPKVHGGILARLELPEDLADLEKQEIPAIALVVVNLYPFEQTIAKSGVTLEEAIEQIDIGGPAMIRAAAKNHQYVTVLSDPSQYSSYLEEIANHNGKTRLEFRQSLALAAFKHTQSYDYAISQYLAQDFAQDSQNATEFFTLKGQKLQTLRYGENPHQPATWYQLGDTAYGWTTAQQLQGKELSYNNLLDLEAARTIIAEFIDDDPAAVIVKHNNPCGVAISPTLVDAYKNAFNADSISAFGGIVAFNRTVDVETAAALTTTFLECIVAPNFDPEALEILKAKPNLRVLRLPNLSQGETTTVKVIAGGVLVQKSDDIPVDPTTWEIVTTLKPTEEELAEMVFAWKVARHVKSNAIVITSDRTTLGIGAGQMNRVGSAQIALTQAESKTSGANIQNATLASDGFFPFDDTVRLAASKGIKYIVQPGGSLRDQDSIKAAEELGLIMAITHTRHFLH